MAVITMPMIWAIVKHTGNQVANGDELNGITFGGVGNGTVVKNAPYFDDQNSSACEYGKYVARETIRLILTKGNGTVTNALIIQSEPKSARRRSYSKKI